MTIEGYRFTTPIEVRFADLDVLGHLNNATYLTYVEQARILYVRDVCGWNGYDWTRLGMILARTEIDYKLPIAYDDEATVYTRVCRIGGKSFDFEYVITRRRNKATPDIAAEVKTIMVAYDYDAETSIPVPDMWRERITAYEPNLSAEH